MTVLIFGAGVAFGLVLAGAWAFGMRMADDYRRRMGIDPPPRSETIPRCRHCGGTGYGCGR